MFCEVIEQLDGGNVHVELSERLADVVRGVQATGKKGELILKLKVSSAQKGNHEAIFLLDSIQAKIPQPDRPSTLFFVGPDYTLLRDNPKQILIPPMEEDRDEKGE